MSERHEETAVTEVRRGPDGPPPGDGPPPPWWRENWWIPLIVLLLLVGLLIAFFALRGGDDEEAAPDDAVVPSVIGQTEAEARETLREQGLEAEVAGTEESDEPEGTVVAQRPESGTTLPRGAVVELILSGGEPEVVTENEVVTEPEEPETEVETETVETAPPEPQVVEVPDVVGGSHLDAAATIEETGLIGNTYPVESQQERGTAVAQNPDPGTQLREGQPVRVNVSLGTGERETRQVPNVTGRDESEARRILYEAGFLVRTLDREAPQPRHVGVVILQQPEPQSAPILTQVTIFVGR